MSKNKDLYINKFDKGNGVVLDTKLNYVKKMTDILSDKTKFKFKGGAKEKDNLEYFIKQEEKFNSSLYYLKWNERIKNEFYTAVRSTGAQPSKLYGLAKIHNCLLYTSPSPRD